MKQDFRTGLKTTLSLCLARNKKKIEEYPDDPRGPSCLIIGYGLDSRPIHIVCAPEDEFLAVITAYLPDAGEWSENFRERIKP